VVDLQGVKDGNMFQLTDPVIHCRHPEKYKLSGTNLMFHGMRRFFTTHKCSEFCRKFGLSQVNPASISDEMF
jgi:hypothetical protein